MFRAIATCVFLTLSVLLFSSASPAQPPQTPERTRTVITVTPSRKHQVFDGMGCGTIFYTGHITSFAKRDKHDLQERYYDEIFSDLKTQFLHVMIRPNYEPTNDNQDPYLAEFSTDAFEINEPVLEVCSAAKSRRPDMKLFATLYTPPAWMKTNGDESGGGEVMGTLKPGHSLEMGEYIWAYLRHMQQNGHPVDYLSICNESDWKHTQPSYYLDPQQHAQLFKEIAEYLDEMARRFPEIRRPELVAANLLSAVDTATKYWPEMITSGADDQVAVVGAHDYDRRGHRWKTLRDVAGNRPLWCTEWCVNGVDQSDDLIKSANEFWLAMTEAFNDGVNVWMAYDWAYPPREGGEALTHIEWGKSYHKTKIYHGFRQWCNALDPGMRVVETDLQGPDSTGTSTPGVKACAFVKASDKNSPGRLVLHVANVQDRPSSITVRIAGDTFANAKVEMIRTSSKDTEKPYPAQQLPAKGISDSLKARELVTYIVTPLALK
ncbi:glycoside hydrolase [Rubripirellula reticaptiva]|uniref:Uncharacterized protein n=1 Tax=Rubripirellula reticaptiva TaxID=2528013 RepID=A0A5C6EIB9_9BACT|nr:hypothetical protein [Rubripirellula reticaptiva]TWU48195.1 hypothetical protein Poly59_50410 [Rubripirellula reticaptiva]